MIRDDSKRPSTLAEALGQLVFERIAKPLAEYGELAQFRTRGLTPVGFWWTGTMSKLPHPRDLIDRSWNPRERDVVLAYVRDGQFRGQAYMGGAWCRLGCAGMFGSADMSDGVYVWPEGLEHYIGRHGVRPPGDFVQHVLQVVRRPQPQRR